MADEPRPQYTKYRSRPSLGRLFKRDRPADPVSELRHAPPPGQAPAPPGHQAPPPYTPYRSGRTPGRRLRVPAFLRRRSIIGYAVLAAIGWVLLSLLLFMISAQLQRDNVSADTLDGGGFPLTTPTTVLFLGSDARTKETSEPGSQVGGRGRSDSILLMRVGAGKSARLSIPRDTVVDIPGRGRDKINAAYAIGGTDLAIQTVKEYLGIEINHVVEVDFENFPALIDALGGINVRTGCVISRINGGFKNGGFTLRLKSGKNHLNGRQALALARTRKNECNPRENDLTRARRQQKILGAMKARLLSPTTFFRLPLVSWQAPKAVRSDMAGPNLMGLFAAMATTGSPRTQVLGRVQPDGGVAVTDEEKQREVRRFLEG